MTQIKKPSSIKPSVPAKTTTMPAVIGDTVASLRRRQKPSDPDGGFPAFAAAVREWWNNTSIAPAGLFATNAAPEGVNNEGGAENGAEGGAEDGEKNGGKKERKGLYSILLASLATPELRAHYDCRTCRDLVDRYGGLVVVQEDGEQVPAMWPLPSSVPEVFQQGVALLREKVRTAAIVGPFITVEYALGTRATESLLPKEKRENGEGEGTTVRWEHLCVGVPDLVRRSKADFLVLSVEQKVAEKVQDRDVLERALEVYGMDVLERGVALLASGTLRDSVKETEQARWLLGLRLLRSTVRHERRRSNLLWVAAATAPAGWCKPRGQMLGTLLDGIKEGNSAAALTAAWNDKKAPEVYRHATTAPAAGNVAAAEKILERLGAAGSLERRYATLGDVEAIWWSPDVMKGGGAKGETEAAVGAVAQKVGVFAHLATRDSASAMLSASTMPAIEIPDVIALTWDKFARTVLQRTPSILGLDVYVQPTLSPRFAALVAPVNREAPPLLQWPSGVSWFYGQGVDATMRERVVAAGGMVEGVDIRATLLWHNRNDLDIHVIAPSGEEIYYAYKRSRCGGALDVDMNVRGETTTPVENIRWPKMTAPDGQYRVYVQNYRFHEVAGTPTPWEVEIEIQGQVMHFSGISSGSTGQASNQEVFSFSFSRARPWAPTARLADWNMAAGWCPVTAVTLSPNLWGEEGAANNGRKHVFFLLQGCRDRRPATARRYPFLPEHLRAEYHAVRATMDAYARSASLPGAEEGDACGLGFSADGTWDILVRVRGTASTAVYKIDRID